MGYYLGKYLNKMRKKRANELSDEFDYKPEFSIEPESDNAINSWFLNSRKNQKSKN